VSTDDIARAFWIEGFQDYLGFEVGSSRNTVQAYLRDVRRLAEYAVSRGAKGPAAISPKLLREFVFHLKDLGLASASIRRQISAVRTYYQFLVGERHVRSDPSERLETPKGWQKLPAVLTRAEVRRFWRRPIRMSRLPGATERSLRWPTPPVSGYRNSLGWD
jgi:integrase/recombinase XerD